MLVSDIKRCRDEPNSHSHSQQHSIPHKTGSRWEKESGQIISVPPPRSAQGEIRAFKFFPQKMGNVDRCKLIFEASYVRGSVWLGTLHMLRITPLLESSTFAMHE